MRRLSIFIVLFSLLAPSAVEAEEEQTCNTRFRLFEMGNDCDVSIMPLNAVMGYGMTFDATNGVGSFTIGVDVVTLTWEALFVTVTELRVSFFSVCYSGLVSGDSCGITADFFVAPRLGVALYPGRTRMHQIVFGVAAGWGSVGTGWGGRTGGDGGLVLSAAIRYAVMGAFGIEVQAIFPVTGDLGDHYPASVFFNLTGFPALLIAAVR